MNSIQFLQYIEKKQKVVKIIFWMLEHQFNMESSLFSEIDTLADAAAAEFDLLVEDDVGDWIAPDWLHDTAEYIVNNTIDFPLS